MCKNWVVRSYQTIEKHLEVGIAYTPLGFIHDEIQVASLPEHVDRIKEILESSIMDVGQSFNLNVPLAAEAKHGNSWADCH